MNQNLPTLGREKAVQMAQSLAEIVRLSNKTIKEKNDDSLLAGHQEFLRNAFLQHASEFLACWFAVADEYEPMINLLTRVQQRIGATVAMQQMARTQGLEQSGNIVAPTEFKKD